MKSTFKPHGRRLVRNTRIGGQPGKKFILRGETEVSEVSVGYDGSYIDEKLPFRNASGTKFECFESKMKHPKFLNTQSHTD